VYVHPRRRPISEPFAPNLHPHRAPFYIITKKCLSGIRLLRSKCTAQQESKKKFGVGVKEPNQNANNNAKVVDMFRPHQARFSGTHW
jgi:hypothetical protein